MTQISVYAKRAIIATQQTTKIMVLELEENKCALPVLICLTMVLKLKLTA